MKKEQLWLIQESNSIEEVKRQYEALQKSTERKDLNWFWILIVDEKEKFQFLRQTQRLEILLLTILSIEEKEEILTLQFEKFMKRKSPEIIFYPKESVINYDEIFTEYRKHLRHLKWKYALSKNGYLQLSYIIPLLSHKGWQQFTKPKFLIHVFTYNRPQSLQRLLNSLSNAFYLSDTADLMIHIEAKADQETLKLVQLFDWPYGKKEVKRRWQQAGLMTTLMESWYPLTNEQYAVMLEDDIEVSPFWYVWSKSAVLTYAFDKEVIQLQPNPSLNIKQRIFGISLFTPRSDELSSPRQPFDPEIIEGPFLMQVPCSWGAIYFPSFWREFIDYTHERDPLYLHHPNPNATEQRGLHLYKSVSQNWKQSWKRYFLEMICVRGYFMIYPNLHNQTSFSTNHVEEGVHISHGLSQNSAFRYWHEVPLLLEQDDELIQKMKMIRVEEMKVLDYHTKTINDLKVYLIGWRDRLYNPQWKEYEGTGRDLFEVLNCDYDSGEVMLRDVDGRVYCQ